MNIIDISDYDLEDTCHALNKIQAIAELFNPEMPGEGRNLSQDGLHGIHVVLRESVFELRTIIKKEVRTIYDAYGLQEEVKELKEHLESYRQRECDNIDVIRLSEMKMGVKHGK